MGLRHAVVVDGELMVKGIITRSDMNEHRLEHYWHEEGEKMQKEMNIDSLPTAIAYETRTTHEHGHGIRRRSASVQSNTTADTVDSDIDPEILLNDQEISDSPNMPLRKRIAI